MRSTRRSEVIATLRAAGCVFAEDEAELLFAAAPDDGQLDAMVARRCAGEPLELVVGWVEFCGVRVDLAPGVFVPRRRTEVLARVAITHTRHIARGASVREPRSRDQRDSVARGASASEPRSRDQRDSVTVLDLCCGSGAIGLAIASSVSGVRLVASDIDPVAVRCALHNLASVGARVVCGDLFAAVPTDLAHAVDVLVANVPYVPSSAIVYLPSEARDHEPRQALDGGDDGLDVLRRIAMQASSWLAPHGRFFVETSPDQSDIALAIMRRCDLDADVVVDDELDVAIVIARQRTGS